METAVYLRFYMHEGQHLHHKPLYEWLLELAKSMGISGGSAFRAIAGYGRHRRLHEEHFFELAGDLPVEVVFTVRGDQERELLDRLRQEGVSIPVLRSEVSIGRSDDPRDGSDSSGERSCT